MFNARSALTCANVSLRCNDGWCRTSRQCPSAGYTIIEVAVVMLIMGIVAAAAVPAFYESLLHHRLESAARRVKQDLEYLRDTAKATSTTRACEFSGFSYVLDEDAVTGLDHGGAYTVDLSAPPYEVTGVSLDLENDSSIEFNGYGEVTGAGEITLGLGDDSRVITVDGDTGEITLTGS